MGIMCCQPGSRYNITSKKIYQLQRVPGSKAEEAYSLFNETNNNIPGLIYDTEEEKTFHSSINLRIISSLKGISEINADNALFLCGINSASGNNGSFLFRIDDNQGKVSTLSMLINSQFTHVYPCGVYGEKTNKIFCIGGHVQQQCEGYDIVSNKWHNLPELPEERYQCNVVFDNNYKFLYLFGGKEKGKFIHDDCFLRLNIENAMFWEKIIVKNNGEFLCTANSACFTFKEDKNGIYIVGGANKQGEVCDEIIRYHIGDKEANRVNVKGRYKTKFYNQSYNFVYDDFVFLDFNGNLHEGGKESFGLIDKRECTLENEE